MATELLTQSLKYVAIKRQNLIDSATSFGAAGDESFPLSRTELYTQTCPVKATRGHCKKLLN